MAFQGLIVSLLFFFILSGLLDQLFVKNGSFLLRHRIVISVALGLFFTFCVKIFFAMMGPVMSLGLVGLALSMPFSPVFFSIGKKAGLSDLLDPLFCSALIYGFGIWGVSSDLESVFFSSLAGLYWGSLLILPSAIYLLIGPSPLIAISRTFVAFALPAIVALFCAIFRDYLEEAGTIQKYIFAIMIIVVYLPFLIIPSGKTRFWKALFLNVSSHALIRLFFAPISGGMSWFLIMFEIFIPQLLSVMVFLDARTPSTKKRKTSGGLRTRCPGLKLSFILHVIILSCLVHVGLVSSIKKSMMSEAAKKTKVQVNIVEKKPEEKKEKKDTDVVIETPQTETPKNDIQTHYLANKTHRVKEETAPDINMIKKTSSDSESSSAANTFAILPGNKRESGAEKNGEGKSKAQETKENAEKSDVNPLLKKPLLDGGTISSLTESPEAKKTSADSQRRSALSGVYGSLLPAKSEMNHQVQKGFKDFIKEKKRVGARIELNTEEFRYLGYFTSIKKSIRLAWFYPDEAAREGQEGDVTVEITIGKSGRIRQVVVIESSGHDILDRTIIKTIRNAGPFPPLPKDMGNELVVVGVYSYILTE